MIYDRKSALSRWIGLAFCVATFLFAAAGDARADPDFDGALKAFNTQQYQQAIDLSSKSIAARETIEALYIRGNAYAAVGRFNEAEGDLDRARADAVAGGGGPMVAAIDGRLLAIYLSSGDSEKGLALYRDLKSKAPNDTRLDDTLAQSFEIQASVAMRAHRYGDARTALERAATALPSRSAGFYALAAYDMSADPGADWKKVKAEADKSLAVDPNNARAHYVAGVALANQGDIPSSVAELQKAKAGSDAPVSRDAEAALASIQPK